MLYLGLGQHPTRVFPLYIWNARCRRAGTFTSPRLAIDYRSHEITAEDEEGIIIALKQRDCVHRVCFELPVTILQKVIVAMDEEYGIPGDRASDLGPLDNFQKHFKPHFRLSGFTFLIGCRLLMTAMQWASSHPV
jgi:hypothetical protein